MTKQADLTVYLFEGQPHLLSGALGQGYEPFAGTKRRRPDFVVAYRANLVFNIEVGRVCREENGISSG